MAVVLCRPCCALRPKAVGPAETCGEYLRPYTSAGIVERETSEKGDAAMHHFLRLLID